MQMPRVWLVPLCALVAACASGPIPAGEKPSWVSAPASDPRYPPGRFVAAVGSTSVGQRPAPELLASVDLAARAAVAAALQSTISAEVSSYESVQAQGGRTQERLSAEQRVRQVVQDFDLTAAVEVPARWRDGDTAYAWAVLDKSKALALQQGKVADHETLARELLAQGMAAEGEAPAAALRSYARARTEAEAALGGVLLLRALGGKTVATSTVADAEGKLDRMLGQLVLTIVDGDRQRAAEGKALPQPVVFSASIAGRPAGGLPIAVKVPGGRAEPAVTAGPDGRVQARVDDIGKFARAEQQIHIGLDWPRLLGVPADKAPAWTAVVPRAGITAVAVKKSIETTRVLILLHEKVEGGGPVAEPPVTAAVSTALHKAGFDVQEANVLLQKYGAERLAAFSDAQVKEEARNKADVVVVGTVISRYSSNFGATTVWHRARADVRAIEVATGQVLFQAPATEVKGERPGELNVAGRSALEALAKALSPGLEQSLRAASAQ